MTGAARRAKEEKVTWRVDRERRQASIIISMKADYRGA